MKDKIPKYMESLLFCLNEVTRGDGKIGDKYLISPKLTGEQSLWLEENGYYVRMAQFDVYHVYPKGKSPRCKWMADRGINPSDVWSVVLIIVLIWAVTK